MIVVAEDFPNHLCGREASHDDHRAEGNVLKNQGKAFVAALFRHHLSLGAELIEMVCWRHGHRASRAWLERNLLPGLDPLFLADHLADFLVEPLGSDAGGNC